MLKLDRTFLTAKWGPLPAWAWMAIGLGAALAYTSWRNNKKQQDQQQPDDSADNGGVQLIGGNQRPPVVFQSYTTINNPLMPPAAGRPTPPVYSGPALNLHPVLPQPPIATTPVTTPVVTAPAAPAGTWVTVAKWTSSNTPWNSTLWGIAQHVRGNGNDWGLVWSDPANAALKARRKDPKFLQAGDKVFVPAKS